MPDPLTPEYIADEIEEYVREGGHEAVLNKRQGLAGAAS